MGITYSDQDVLIATLRRMAKSSGCSRKGEYAFVAGYLAGLAVDAASADKGKASVAVDRIRALAARRPE